MTSVIRTGKSILLFRKNNLDAFIAAFVYWYLFGQDSVRSTDTIVSDGPMIRFREIDVFEDVSLHPTAKYTLSTGKIWTYIGNGDTVIPIGINMSHLQVPAASPFFSYENDATFTPEESMEGCQYHYDQKKTLTQLMLESLLETGHIRESDKSFVLLNQFFRFFEGNSNILKLNDEVLDRIMMYFPQLRVADFKELGTLIEDGLKFMEQRRKRSPEEAVREHIKLTQTEAFERSMMAEGYHQQTGIPLRLINSPEVLTARPLYARNLTEATFVYQFVTDGVRGRYYSSTQGENALEVFPTNRPKIGNAQEAEWLISVQDFYSLNFVQKLN